MLLDYSSKGYSNCSIYNSCDNRSYSCGNKTVIQVYIPCAFSKKVVQGDSFHPFSQWNLPSVKSGSYLLAAHQIVPFFTRLTLLALFSYSVLHVMCFCRFEP